MPWLCCQDHAVPIVLLSMGAAVQAPPAVLPALQELIAKGTYRPWQQSTLPASLQDALQGG